MHCYVGTYKGDNDDLPCSNCTTPVPVGDATTSASYWAGNWPSWNYGSLACLPGYVGVPAPVTCDARYNGGSPGGGGGCTQCAAGTYQAATLSGGSCAPCPAFPPGYALTAPWGGIFPTWAVTPVCAAGYSGTASEITCRADSGTNSLALGCAACSAGSYRVGDANGGVCSLCVFACAAQTCAGFA